RTANAKRTGEASEHDLEFHELLVRAAKHKRLLSSWLALKSQIRLLLTQMDRDDIEFARHAANAHQEFLTLLRARDRKKALAVLELQLEDTHRTVVEHYREQNSDDEP